MGISLFTVALWTAYPVVWALAEGSNMISADAEVLAYAVLDILAKSVFGFWLLGLHARIPEAQVAYKDSVSATPIPTQESSLTLPLLPAVDDLRAGNPPLRLNSELPPPSILFLRLILRIIPPSLRACRLMTPSTVSNYCQNPSSPPSTPFSP
jgi:hypothetical protein